MTINELQNLRNTVIGDYKYYLVKNVKDLDGKIYPISIATNECSDIGNNLLALIDAEIGRQTVVAENDQNKNHYGTKTTLL